MANPLEIGSESPPPPNPQGGNVLQGTPAQPQAMPAPPTHAQTVAALRHFDAIKGELKTLWDDPALGKSDVKKQAIDGVAKLVAERFMSAADAVIQLSQFPTDPLQQRKFVQKQLLQVHQAEQGILAHHAAGFAGQGPQPTPSSDNHMDTMAALQSAYGAK